MRICLSGRMFGGTSAYEQIEAAARFGYDGVALMAAHVHPGMDDSTRHTLKEALQQAGVHVRRIGCDADTAGDFAAWLALALDLGAARLEVAADCDPRWLADAAHKATEAGVALALRHGEDIARSVSLVESITSAGIGLVLDPLALLRAGKTLDVEMVTDLAPHVSDVSMRDGVLLSAFEERRILQGGLDWRGILSRLERAGFDGVLCADCSGEAGGGMPTRAALARACMHDVKMLTGAAYDKESWLHLSPRASGMHAVIAPSISDCEFVWIYRMNLQGGEKYRLETGAQEMNVIVIRGSVVARSIAFDEAMRALDSFYLPGGAVAELEAQEDAVLYIGAAVCEGYGTPLFRRFDLSLPLGEIHQIHGGGSGRREVFFTVDPGHPASRLLCGVTFSEDGAWTSWPPHQHERDLEEVYCYFDIPENRFGMHLSYAVSGDVEEMAVHVVRDGTMVLAPRGYHTTVATPTMRNAYFWVLAAHSHASRRYDLAVEDPVFSEKNDDVGVTGKE